MQQKQNTTKMTDLSTPLSLSHTHTHRHIERGKRKVMKEEEVLQSKQWNSYWLGGTEVLIGSSCECVCLSECVQEKERGGGKKTELAQTRFCLEYIRSGLQLPSFQSVFITWVCIRRHGPV